MKPTLSHYRTKRKTDWLECVIWIAIAGIAFLAGLIATNSGGWL